MGLTAVMLAAGLVASQIFLGGWWYPALAAPGYLLVGAAAVLAGVLFWRAEDAPGAWCTLVTLLFAVYCFWRQLEAPDWYAARENDWLLLGALSVYFTVAWHLRAVWTRAVVLGALFAVMVGQVMLTIAQFAADSPFHPLASWALHMGLPGGGEAMANHGFVTGTLASRGTLSSVLLVTAFLSLGMLVWGRGGAALKMVLLWVTAAGFAGLTLSMSRSAYLGVPVGVGVFALVSFFILQRGAVAHRSWLGAGALLLVMLAMAAGLAIGSESILVQMRLANLGEDVFREDLWFEAVPPMLSLDPWLGAGANMFDQLFGRYRGGSFSGRAVHAHNDWLQLLIEYGRLGLILGGAFFVVHLAAGWRNAMRLARETPPVGWMPQSTELGLLTGGLSAFASMGIHAFFDYRLHVPAAALLVALCAGWLSGARNDSLTRVAKSMPWWLRPAAFILPALTGSILVVWVLREAPAEQRALAAENALLRDDFEGCWNLATQGLGLQPRNPRLLTLAGEAAGLIGNTKSSAAEQESWYERSAAYFAEVNRERPFFAYGLRERALALDWAGETDAALPWHLRAIARDPDNPRGYEYLGLHYWRQGRLDEAERLLRFARHFPGARLAGEYLKKIAEERRSDEAGKN